jgi:hypothetical protein
MRTLVHKAADGSVEVEQAGTIKSSGSQKEHEVLQASTRTYR